MINHRILQICDLFADINSFSIGYESLHFRHFPQNVVNAKFEQRNSHEKLRNGRVKVIENNFANSVGTLIIITFVSQSGESRVTGVLPGVPPGL